MAMESIIESALQGEEDKPEASFERLNIIVAGIGGGGNNTINRMCRLGVKGATLMAINTDAQHLKILDDKIEKVLIGKGITRGLGAGGYPEIGRKAAEVDKQKLEEKFRGAHLVFVCAGMGGGTGTGAAPVVAKIAKEQGAITIAMVTYPFALERARLKKADEGIEELREYADSVIVLDNNRLVQIVPNLPMNEAFLVADEILSKAIGGLVHTINEPSLVNIDFADVKAIMGHGDVGMIAVGTGRGASKVDDAIADVLRNKLLDVDFAGAKGAIIHIAGGHDLTLGDAIKAGEGITEHMDPHANVKWGARLVPNYDGKIEICAIVTGVHSPQILGKAEKKEPEKKGGNIEVLS